MVRNIFHVTPSLLYERGMQPGNVCPNSLLSAVPLGVGVGTKRPRDKENDPKMTEGYFLFLFLNSSPVQTIKEQLWKRRVW